MMTFRKIQVVQVKKGNDKIVITLLAYNDSTSPMIHSKAKTSITSLAKQASEHTLAW